MFPWCKMEIESPSLLISQLLRNPLGILQTLQITPPKKLQRTSTVCLLKLPLLGEETALTILRLALGICSPEEKLKRTTYFPEFQNPKVSSPTTILSPMFTCKTWALFLLHKCMSSDYRPPAILRPYTKTWTMCFKIQSMIKSEPDAQLCNTPSVTCKSFCVSFDSGKGQKLWGPSPYIEMLMDGYGVNSGEFPKLLRSIR